ncbi:MULTISPECIES: type VI secretion system contractile sheath large subunit [Cysteiniphilum]|uniref:Intracellular growth locus iglB n=1 Tax=Cysteiniphilum litorale TaxID=2056700 RepID=A0A8J2Z2Q7_9GAMM|nr:MULTISPECIES: type VI secretion system contractile sheath large subunit [Cysteiniphilum]GGF91002.1 intracellular growth locus iglB [Cysteiniphilum litorale]
MSQVLTQLVGLVNDSNAEQINALMAQSGVNEIAITRNMDSAEQELKEFLVSMTAVMAEMQEPENFSKEITARIKAKIDDVIDKQLNEVISNEDFKYLESMWLSLNDVFEEAGDHDEVEVVLHEVSKDELIDDFELNSADYTGSDLFKRVYTSEYDQYGGEPYSLVVGMFDIGRQHEDLLLLSNIGKVCAAAHAPFITNIGPQFFGYDSFESFDEVRDLNGLLNSSKYAAWNRFRQTEEAAYVGLTFPRYLLRRPYAEDSPELYASNARQNYSVTFFKERLHNLFDNKSYLWGGASVLFAKNVIKSFKKTGWSQYIRGPLGGGLIDDLSSYEFNISGYTQKTGSVEYFVSDSQEYEFSRAGFIPFVGDKRAEGGCFFSAQSARTVLEDEDNPDLSETAQANANLAYTLSVCRIAHYVKSIVRDRVGSNYDHNHVQKFLSDWIGNFVTIAANPSDVTLAYYPFKEANVAVLPQTGRLGWYKCQIDLVPHVQLEGIDVSMRLATKLPITLDGSANEAESDSAEAENEGVAE